MQIGRNFNFSLYSVWTIKVFFLTVHVLLQLKHTKKNILIRTFMLLIVTILWDMNIFQNLEKAGDFFFFNPSQEIGTIKKTRNTVMVKSWGKAVGSMA